MTQEFSSQGFQPVILGANLNAYSLAREFHEKYNIKSVVLGKFWVTQIIHSSILDFIQVKDLENKDNIILEVNLLAKKFADKKVLLLGCSDTLLKVIIENKIFFLPNVVIPYVDFDLVETLMNKESFYILCDKHNVPYPKTFIHNKDLKENYSLNFSFPVVLKPSDQPKFFSKKFFGQKKIYIIQDKQELDKEMQRIYDSGYDDTLIIQEYIAGDDSYMYVLNAYVDSNHKVTFLSLAHIFLEEHTPSARGNHAVLVNDYNETLFKMIKKFLEDIKFTGFGNFDIKYDTKDNTYKFFEMNVRQGNSHYHTTAAGYNITEFLVDDRIFGKDRKLIIVKNKKLFLIVPKLLALFYVKRNVCRKEMLSLMLKGQVVNPLFYKKDLNLRRLFYLYLNSFGHYLKFFRYFKNQE
jgi:D-aspartate ligase